MKDKRTETIEDETKHRKKSVAKGRSRADHKHQYEVVLLTKYYRYTDYKTGKMAVGEGVYPHRVCVICGRIGELILHDKKYYTKTLREGLPVRSYDEILNEYALSLPKWYAEDFFDKFAKPEEDK